MDLDLRTVQGQQLARRLYDYKIARLEQLSAGEKESLLREFPSLSDHDFQYVIQELIQARRYQQERVGWQAVPHDLAVIFLVVFTSLFTLPAGIIVGIAVLVLFEVLFQVYFNRKLYPVLSSLVWLTYPAYAWLAYLLYQRGYALPWIILTVILVWGGTFLLGMLARLPYRLMVEEKAKSAGQAGRPKNKIS